MEEIKKLLEELRGEVKEEAPEFGKAVAQWGAVLAQIKMKKATATPRELAQLRTTEEFAWSGVLQKKAQYSTKIESGAWRFIEKLLVLLRNVALS